MVFKTLVHKGAMPIARHAVRTFVAAFQGNSKFGMGNAEWFPASQNSESGIRNPESSPVSDPLSAIRHPALSAAPSAIRHSPSVLELHSDGSLDADDWAILEAAAGNLPTKRVEPEERRETLSRKLVGFPLSAKLLERGGYMAKMGVLASAESPFFYFDSDIVWLRAFELTTLPPARTVFSTETWSWYFGIQKPGVWIREKVPGRVNSGFAWMSERFPFDRFERLLADGLYTPDHTYSTDQEILAFLFPNSQSFSLSDFFRTRVGVTYDLPNHPAVAIHFPGGMWKPHLDQIETFEPKMDAPRQLMLESPAPLSWPELLRMYGLLSIERNYVLQRTANLVRWILRR